MSFTASTWFDPSDPFNTRYTRVQAKGPSSMPNFIGGDTRDDDEPRGIHVARSHPATPMQPHWQRTSFEKPDDLWVRGTGKDADVTVYMATHGETRTLVQRHLYLRKSNGQHRYFLFEIPMSCNTQITVPDEAMLCELEALRYQYSGSL